MTDEELSKVYVEELMKQMLQEHKLEITSSLQLVDHVESDHKREPVGWSSFEDLKASHQLMHDTNCWDHSH